jgi:hypothetical protein
MTTIDDLCKMFNSSNGPPSINSHYSTMPQSEFRQNNVPIVEEYDEDSDNHAHEFLQLRADIRSIKSDIYDIRMMLSSILSIQSNFYRNQKYEF